jgi:hypothetical protein
MELKGRFNTKMIKKAKFGDVYFDEMGSFDSVERDRVTNKVSSLVIRFIRFGLTSVGALGCCSEGPYFQAHPRLACAIDTA